MYLVGTDKKMQLTIIKPMQIGINRNKYTFFIIKSSECGRPNTVRSDHAGTFRLVAYVSKVQLFYIQITEHTGWESEERRGVFL
jgi:hypothetical protein